MRDRVIGYELRWLLAVLNWAASPGSGGGSKRLIPANPLDGYPAPSEASPRRPVLDGAQYAAMLEAAAGLPPLFAQALVLARETGHRVGAIRLLRWSDVDEEGAEPVSRHVLKAWWRKAAKTAKLSKGNRLGWHSLRRQLATDLEGTPLVDLAAPGGWKATKTITECYQRPDAEPMREALAKRRPLESAGAAEGSP